MLDVNRYIYISMFLHVFAQETTIYDVLFASLDEKAELKREVNTITTELVPLKIHLFKAGARD